ncbi:hypothetical protein [Gaetbulibacter aestuarii]|uniref:DUF4468 domain-containing protein n=1 Tax=Gaetbulibacter aestuarii TaxID=1502358 RepID=A0ABW7MY32_9FLAO
MKKTLLLLIMPFVLLENTQAQSDVQGPNKEETIYWLKTYALPKMRRMSYQIYSGTFSIYNDRFVYRLVFPYNGELVSEQVVNFEDLKYVYTDKCSMLFWESEGESQGEFDYTFSKAVMKRNDGKTFDGSTFYFNKNNFSEDELQSVKKAFIHLAELYGAKPAPKVNKNSF